MTSCLLRATMERMSTDRPYSFWRVMFLAEHYGRLIMTLDEVAEQIGMAPGTIKNRRSRGEFAWLRPNRRTLTADVSDVAAYLEQQCRIADEARLSTTATGVHVPRTQRASPRRRR